ncbi:MAG: RNA polymerase sigma-70 factor, partial [Bacteroidota bacterium]
TMHHLSDGDLTYRLQRGDRALFDQIFHSNWDRLFKMAYRIIPEEDLAQDIAQEALMELWEQRKKYKIHNVDGYLTRMVKNKVAYHLRRGKFSITHMERLETLPTVNTTEETIALNEMEENVLSSMDKLPKKSKEVFYLSRFKGLGNEEIAKQLQISRRTVEGHIGRALKQLRTDIQTNFIWLLLWLSGPLL